MHVLVLAKEPLPGRVKTRLCPPLDPASAATLAAAALADTLDAALGSGADRVVLALDGNPGEWCPPGVHVVPQEGRDLDERLTAAWARTGGPGIQIGMDTPQVTPGLLAAAMSRLGDGRHDTGGFDATLGPACDGGWWLIGLRSPHPAIFAGIPTSRADTGERQRRRLAELGLRCATEPTLRDVDHYRDAIAVSNDAPSTRFSRRLGELRDHDRVSLR